MNALDRIDAIHTTASSDVDGAALETVDGGFGGGYPDWGGWGAGDAGKYDGTSWEVDIDGMCYVDGAYY